LAKPEFATESAPTGLHPKDRVQGVRAHAKISRLNIVLAALFAFVGMLTLSNVGSTVSYFTDVESSLGNFFVADPLYFSVTPDSQTIALGSGEATFVPEVVPGAESDPMQYRVQVQMMSGDAAFCQSIGALTTAPFPYDGPLLSLTTATATDYGPWALSLYANSPNVAAGTSCIVDLIYKGWNASATEGVGYSDTHIVSLTFIYQPPQQIETAAPTASLEAIATQSADSSSDADATTTIEVPQQ